jgi:hypothetical protein
MWSVAGAGAGTVDAVAPFPGPKKGSAGGKPAAAGPAKAAGGGERGADGTTAGPGAVVGGAAGVRQIGQTSLAASVTAGPR